MTWNIVVLGGGFAGLTAARRLERRLPHNAAKVTLVNDVNFMLYTPLLPGAAGGTLEPRHVVVPLREELRSTELLLGHVTGADPSRKVVHVVNAAGMKQERHYDQLLVALGSTSRTLPIPGLKEHAIGFKTLSEAIALRDRVVHTMEQAEHVEDDEARRALLSYVVVGAGYAGLEGLAEMQDFASDLVDLYPRCRMTGLRFTLIEARERVMSEIPADLAEYATAELRRRGIEVRTSTTVKQVSDTSVELHSGEVIPARTVCWTAGVKPHPVVSRLGLPMTDGGRIDTDRFCQVAGTSDVWAVGDAAAVPDPARKGQPSPPTAQHALRQAKVAADNMAGALGSGRRRAFRYRTLGVFVDMGRHQAVASTLGIKWHGFPAWFLARSYHLALMPGAKRRVHLILDWTVGLLFGRDASELGQLGHPPSLEMSDESLSSVPAGLGDGTPLVEHSSGGTTPVGERAQADSVGTGIEG